MYEYYTVLSLFCLAQNISHGKPNATQKEIEAAATQAGAHDFISQLPEVSEVFHSLSQCIFFFYSALYTT